MPVVLTAPITRPSQLRSRRMNAAQAVSGSRRDTLSIFSGLDASRAAPAALGRGVGRAMLRHIVGEAKARGYRRLSLETGNTEPFAAALRLYASEGFQPWGSFGNYHDTPFSSFLTLRL